MVDYHENEIANASNMNNMVTIFARKFAERLRRCFHPPVIVKDADAIMTRTIR